MSMGFRQKLKYLREARGMTQKDLALRLGVEGSNPATTIWRYEHGKSDPSLSTTVRLAEILDVTLDDLASPNTDLPDRRSGTDRRAAPVVDGGEG